MALSNGKPPVPPAPKLLVEGEDFYLENGRYVFTHHFLSERGHCCKSGCRHCPYGYVDSAAKDQQAGKDGHSSWQG